MERIRRVILYTLFSFFLLDLMNAQDGFLVRGKVINQTDGEVIIGATIIEEDDNERFINGTITDFNGNFSIKVVNANSTIKVSFIGFKTKSVHLNGERDLEIVLKEDVVEMTQVNVVAERVKDEGFNLLPVSAIASSSASVDMGDIEGVNATSFEGALQGSVASVDIVAGSGDPGSSSAIRIRGMSTLSGGNPLIVIDDIPYDQTINNSFDFGSSDAQDISELLSIPLEDIAGIEVLKDAAATAVYGSKAANGVILLKTKSGVRGKTRFSYEFKRSWNIQPPSIPTLNGDEYITLQREQLFAKEGYYNLPIELAFDPSFPDFYNYSQNTDWISALTQNGFDRNHHFGIQGGGDKTNYYASVSHNGSQGTTINTGLSRLSTRIKLDYRISQKLKITSNFAYSNIQKDGNYEFGNDVKNLIGGSGINLRSMAYIKAPNMSIWEYGEDGNRTGEYFSPITNFQGNGIRYYNPVALSENASSDTYEDVLTSNFTVNYYIMESLKYTGTIAYGYTGQRLKAFLPEDAIGALWDNQMMNKADNSHSDAVSLQTRNQLIFKPNVGKDHFLSSMMALSTYSKTSESLYTTASGAPSPDISDPAAELYYSSILSNKSLSRSVSSLFKTAYVYRNKYTIDGGITVDGVSKIGRRKRWGYFPFVSAAWQMHKEAWLQNAVWLNTLKFRASYGITGNAAGNSYVYFANYNSPNVPSYIDNSVVEPQSIELDNLAFEKLAQQNMGVDISLFDNRVNATFEVYDKKTYDILWKNLEIPSSSGFSTVRYMNGGEMENKGIDFTMDGTVLRQKDWVFRFNFNISRNINTFNSIPENFSTNSYNTTANGEYGRRLVLGEPIGSFYGYKYLGVWTSDEDVVARDANGDMILETDGQPKEMIFSNGYRFRGGDAKYEDLNHDGKINSLDMAYLGGSNPDFFGALGSFLKFKNFTFRTQFYYRYGFDIINDAGMRLENMVGRNNQSKAVLYRWRSQGDDFEGIIPRAVASSEVPNWLGSDRFVEDGSYIRFKSLTLSYDMPASFCKKLFMKKLSASFNMRNLMTWTDYSGQDPEVSIKVNDNDPYMIGMDKAKTPPSKQYTFTLTMQF